MLLLIGAGVLLLLVLALRTAYRRRWSRGLDCSLTFGAEYATEGDTVPLLEVLVNNKLLPFPVAEVDFHLDRRLRFADGRNTTVSDQTYRRDVFVLGPRQRITRRLDLECVGRGFFRVDEAGLLLKDLFLRQDFRTRFPQAATLYILPQPARPPQVELPYARVMGAILSRKKLLDDPFEFAGLREYTRGDPMKYINWKATARTGQLLTNLHESTLSQRVTLLLDVDTSTHPQGELLVEEVIRLASGLSRRLLSAGVELSLTSNGADAQTGDPWRLESAIGGGSFLQLQKRLACLTPGSRLSPICSALEEPVRDPLLVLLTADPRPELHDDFTRLVGKGWGVQLMAGGRPAHYTAPSGPEILWLE